MKTLLKDISSLLYPQTCLLCNAGIQQDDHLCLSCETKLPETNFHEMDNNPVIDRFYGRTEIEKAGAFLFYGAGNNTREILHQIKYKGNTALAMLLGRKYGIILQESNSFVMIDVIIPVPLHSRRFHERGYNQSEWIARGLSESMNLPIDTDAFIRKEYTNTQTKKSRHGRFNNMANAFDVPGSDSLEGKHILLVDDVITTGATLEACALTLQKQVKDIKISIVTLAAGE